MPQKATHYMYIRNILTLTRLILNKRWRSLEQLQQRVAQFREGDYKMFTEKQNVKSFMKGAYIPCVLTYIGAEKILLGKALITLDSVARW